MSFHVEIAETSSMDGVEQPSDGVEQHIDKQRQRSYIQHGSSIPAIPWHPPSHPSLFPIALLNLTLFRTLSQRGSTTNSLPSWSPPNDLLPRSHRIHKHSPLPVSPPPVLTAISPLVYSSVLYQNLLSIRQKQKIIGHGITRWRNKLGNWLGRRKIGGCKDS